MARTKQTARIGTNARCSHGRQLEDSGTEHSTDEARNEGDASEADFPAFP
jgi:hypothetical protein